MNPTPNEMVKGLSGTVNIPAWLFYFLVLPGAVGLGVGGADYVPHLLGVARSESQQGRECAEAQSLAQDAIHQTAQLLSIMAPLRSDLSALQQRVSELEREEREDAITTKVVDLNTRRIEDLERRMGR